MSKFVDNIKRSSRFLNWLRKEKPLAFYIFAAFATAGAVTAIVGSVFFGFLPITAITAAFAGLYIGATAMIWFSLQSRGKSNYNLFEFRKNYPILFWGLPYSFLAAFAIGLLVLYIPALTALVTSNVVAVSLGLSGLPINLLFGAVFVLSAIAGTVGSFTLQGIVDIAKDINSYFDSGRASKESSQPNADGLYSHYIAEADQLHPATVHSYSNPVVGAGGKPSAPKMASSVSAPAPISVNGL